MNKQMSKIFNTDLVSNQMKLSFKSQEAYNKFLAIKQTIMSAETIGKYEISGLDKVTSNIVMGDDIVLSEETELNVINTFIGDFTNEEEIPFISNGKERMIKFVCATKEFGRVLETLPDNPVNIRVIGRTKEKEVTISVRIQPEKADSVSGLCERLDDTKCFFSTYFSEDIRCATFVKKLGRLSELWHKVESISKRFDVSFDISDSGDVPVYIINRLYFICVKKEMVKHRIDDFSQNITLDERKNADDISVGSPIALLWDEEKEYVLFGEKISVHFRKYIFDAIVDSIEKKDSEHYMIKSKSTEEHPIFVVEMDYDTIPDGDATDINRMYEIVKNAKSLDKLLVENLE